MEDYFDSIKIINGISKISLYFNQIDKSSITTQGPRIISGMNKASKN